MAQFRSKPFGVTKNGDKVDEYIISNPGGLEVSVLNYGCVIKNLFVPTKTGPVDVVVGHDTLADYEADFNSSGSTCCGAFVGRYANRIENAEFSLSGKTYKLEANNGKNHLHGTFPRKIYDVKMFGDTLLMETESPAGEDGFPGNLNLKVTYTLTNDNAVDIKYEATTDKPTVVNLTNHSYFNLSGVPGSQILDHSIMIAADTYVPVDETLIPTGTLDPVEGTPMDFRTPTPVGERINDYDFVQLKNGNGYDHNWVLNTKGDVTRKCASLKSPKTGIVLDVYTNEPGIQVYAGNFLDGSLTGKKGITYNQRASVCLETQKYPDTPNKAEWPSAVLRPGEKYTSQCIFKFSVDK